MNFEVYALSQTEQRYPNGHLNVICMAEGYDRYGRDQQIMLNPLTGQWGTPGIWY